MSQKHFWSGVAVGSGAVVGAMFAAGMLGNRGQGQIVRVEKSVQIGSEIENVFRAWAQFERFPQYCRYVTHVRNTGYDRSEWTANFDGRIFNWDAEVTQVIPNQVIAWKSINGSRHDGRITFAPIGHDTLVHVQMNYVPATILARPIMAVIGEKIERYIDQALRDFKCELEQLDHESDLLPNEYRPSAELLPPNVTVGNFKRRDASAMQATGTDAKSPKHQDFTRPPEDSNLRNK